MKEKGRVILVEKFDGQKKIVASAPYNKSEVFFYLEVDSLAMQFQFGESPDNIVNIGEVQSLVALSENETNKFNGTGIGLYATSKGQKSNNKAIFDWFDTNIKMESLQPIVQCMQVIKGVYFGKPFYNQNSMKY